MKTPDEIVICPACYGYGKMISMNADGLRNQPCVRCEGSGRVIQWVEDRPFKEDKKVVDDSQSFS